MRVRRNMAKLTMACLMAAGGAAVAQAEPAPAPPSAEPVEAQAAPATEPQVEVTSGQIEPTPAQALPADAPAVEAAAGEFAPGDGPAFELREGEPVPADVELHFAPDAGPPGDARPEEVRQQELRMRERRLQEQGGRPAPRPGDEHLRAVERQLHAAEDQHRRAGEGLRRAAEHQRRVIEEHRRIAERERTRAIEEQYRATIGARLSLGQWQQGRAFAFGERPTVSVPPGGPGAPGISPHIASLHPAPQGLLPPSGFAGPAQPGSPLPQPVRQMTDEEFEKAKGAQPGWPLLQRARALYYEGRLEKASYLGVTTSPPPLALRQHLRLPEGVGLIVDFVEPGSPAEQSGLKQYDVLQKLNDQLLINNHQLAVLVRTFKHGEPVKLGVIRGGKLETLSATLAERDVKPLQDIVFWNAPADTTVRPGEETLLSATGPEQPFITLRLLPPVPGGPEAAAAEAPVAAPAEAPDLLPYPGDPLSPEGAAPELANPAAGSSSSSAGSSSVFTWSDGQTTLTVTADSGSPHRRLIAKDKFGAVLFEGLLDVAEDRERMPPIVAEKLKKLDAAAPLQPVRPELPEAVGQPGQP